MNPPRSVSQRWLLAADFCAILLAVLVSDEFGLIKGMVGRSMILLAAGVYLMLTAILVFILARRGRSLPEKSSASSTPTRSILGRSGPAFLAYLPRFLMGAVLLGYALWLRR